MGAVALGRVSKGRECFAEQSFARRRAVSRRANLLDHREPDGSGPRILIIASDARVRRSLAVALSLNGFRALEASKGRQALDFVKSKHVDAVLLDVDIPDRRTLNLIRSMRIHGLPVIVAVPDAESDLTAALDAGADDFVVQPVRQREIAARIRIVLQRFTPSQARS